MASISRYRKAMVRRCLRMFSARAARDPVATRAECEAFVAGHIRSFGKRGVKRYSAFKRMRRRKR